MDLRALSTWCRRREISWSPAQSDDGQRVMVLRPRDAGRPWQRMMLVLDDAELRLENELGETLASASDLPALLDAVEGGVADSHIIGGGMVPSAQRVGSSLLGFIL